MGRITNKMSANQTNSATEKSTDLGIDHMISRVGPGDQAHLCAPATEAPSVIVAAATTKDKPFIGVPKVVARICEAAEIEGASLHTLRHSFASVAAELGYSEFVIAGLLGHRAGSVTARYSHLPDSALTAAAERISREIDCRMGGVSELSGKVVGFCKA